MEKVKEFFKKIMEKIKGMINKRNIIIASLILVIILILVLLLITSSSKSHAKANSLDTVLEEMGKDFYENFYYLKIDSNEEKKLEFLKSFETIGIKVDLNNLTAFDNGKYKDKLELFVNEETNKKCDKTKTRVIIFPKKPYKNKDYDIKVELACD